MRRGRVPRAFRFRFHAVVAVAEPGTRRGSARSSLTPILRSPAASSRLALVGVQLRFAGRVRRRPTPNSIGMHPRERRSASRPGGEDGSSALHVPQYQLRCRRSHACAARTGADLPREDLRICRAHPEFSERLLPDGRD